jgi:xanthine/uracil permease
LALQHAATVLAFIAYVLAAAKIAGLSVPQTHSIVALTLLAMGTITALQAWGGRLGSGSLLVFQPDPMMITIAGAAIAASGIGAVVAVTIIVAVVTIVVGPLIGKLRPLFPPTVVGTVICMAGLGLIEHAVSNSLGLDAQRHINGVSVLISGAALASIVACSVWGGRRLKLLGMLVGIAVGLVIAVMGDQLVGLEWVQAAPMLALPERIAPSFGLDPAIIGAIVLITILNQLDNIGCLSMMEKTDNADWRRADMGAIGRGIRANGFGDLLAGMFGSFPTAPCSANIALAHATRSTSRYIGLATAALLLLVALSPKLTMALTLIPSAVLGAVELYAAAYLLVSGIEMVASRALDSRGIFMVGLSLCAGLATMLMPELGQQAPEGLRILVGDGFVVAGFLVVVLNLLFRLGTKQQAQLTLDRTHGALNQQITDFVEQQGAIWAARSDVVRRAASVALEATEAIAAAGRGLPLAVRGSFNEFNFNLELVHAGEPLPLQAAGGPSEMTAEALWEADDAALDAALERVSSVLIHHLADKVSSARTSDGNALLQLHFDH